VSTAFQGKGTATAAERLRDGFLRWQCRVRQMAMREAMGRPDDAIMPMVTLPGSGEPMGRIVTVLSRNWAHSRTPELQHLYRQTNDPAQRREKALALFSAGYYQQAKEFSDTLTATFVPGSPGAEALLAAGRCRLGFDAYSQRFDLDCAVRRLEPAHPLYQATWWHNRLLNPDLHPDTVILAFRPDWESST
jgi:hypothetical protein